MPGGFGACREFRLRPQALMQHARMAMRRRPPTTEATGMTTFLFSEIQSPASSNRLLPLQMPFSHIPPDPQGVPSRKYCIKL